MNSRCLLAGAVLLFPAVSVSQSTVDAASPRVSQAVDVVRPAVLPHAITSFGACRVDRWLYVFGGHIGRAHAHSKDNVIGAFRRYNMVDGHSWQELATGPALQGTALAAAPDGSIYRVGGTDARNEPGADDDMHSTASVSRFDPSVGRWQDMTPLPEPRSSHDAIICDNKLYVVGGWNLQGGSGDWHQNAWVADLDNQPLEWQALPEIGHVRRACAVATFGNKIAVLGGIDDKNMINTVCVFDPVKATWTDGPALPGFAFGTAALGIDGWLYATVMDGRLMKWNGLSDTTWQPVAQLEMPRFFHRMVPSLDGQILAMGGAGRGGHMRTMEHIAIDNVPRLELREYVIPAPSKVAYRQALLLQDNTIWAFGGNRGNPGERFAEDQFATDIWKVELTKMTAGKVGDLPSGRQSMASVIWGDRDQNLMIGGVGLVNGKVQSLSSGVSFNLRRQKPSAANYDLDAPRTQCQVAHYEGKLYVLGGIDFTPGGGGGSSKGDTREVLVCDLSEQHPKFVASGITLPRARRSFGIAAIGSKLYLIGGLGNGFDHAGPCDVFDFVSKEWTELAAPSNWVSPQVAVLGDRIYVACGGTMKGQSFKQDRSVMAYDPSSGWSSVVEELPFGTRHVRMLPHRNRLLFYSANDERRDRIVIRLLEPDHASMLPEAPFHR